MEKFSTELERYFLTEPAAASGPRDGNVTLNELLTLAGERTFGFLFVMLSLPSALPIPAPGYSIPFGVVMALLAWQLIAGARQPWLPARWRQRGFNRDKVRGVIKTGLPWLRRIEMISRPRLASVCTSVIGRMVIGCAILLMSLCMMIPIPGTNTLPAIGIFLIGFGLLDDDGLISLGGFMVCAFALALVLAIFILGVEVIDRIKSAVIG